MYWIVFGRENQLRGQNLDTFTDLKILSLQSNRITKMQGLEGLINLEELYLSHNGLKKIEGLEKNVGPLSSRHRHQAHVGLAQIDHAGCGE